MHPAQRMRNSAKGYLRKYWKILLAVTALQVVAYMYLFTGVTFTNHTFPNVWISDYPSYRTQGEGRWLADMLIQLAGGSGNQSVQMSIAVTLQSVNGVLLAIWLNLKRQFDILIIAALLCLFPAFLDYYGFAVDHISFVAGDTLCILGGYLLKQNKIAPALGSSALYALSLAIYGPKISLVSFTAIAAVVLQVTESGSLMAKSRYRQTLKIPFLSVLSVIGAMALYWFSYKITASYTMGGRTHTNNLNEVIPELTRSYSNAIQYFSGDLGGLPFEIRFLPLLIIVAGASTAIVRALRARGRLGAFLVVIAVLLSPLAINATWIVNREAWPTPGRLYTAYAYFFLFYLAFLLRCRIFSKLSEVAALAILVLFFTLASQQANALAMKTIYEVSFVNRIVQRVEPLLPEATATGAKPALVVVGDIPAFDVRQYIRFPARLGTSHALTTGAFIWYRHIEIFNFFVGRQDVRRPSMSEQKMVIDRSHNVEPWPSEQATFRTSQAIGVVLEKYNPGVSVTWNDKQ